MNTLNVHSSPNHRLYYIDNLRSFVIFVVVVFHAAMAFMVYAPDWWPVLDPQRSLFFTALVLLTDVPIMPIMFMIAGYFGMASLIRKGQGTFWKDKLLRIVLPWILGFLVVAPFSPYLWLVARKKAPPFDYFWLHLFFTKTFNTQGALWFLGVLIVFYLALSFAFSLCKPLRKTARDSGRPGLIFFLLFLVIPAFVFIGINQFFFDFSWVPIKYVLWVQPTRVSLEAFYFALGVYAYRQRWFGSGGYVPRSATWLPLALVSGGVFLCYKFHFGFLMPQLSVRVGHGLLHCLFCLSTTLGLIGFFHTYFDRSSAFLAKFSNGSYAIYWIHMPLVLLSNLAVRGYHWNIYVKYLVVCLLSVLASFLAGAYGLAWLPMFSHASGGRSSTPPTEAEIESATAVHPGAFGS